MGTLADNDRLTGPFSADAGQTDFAADFPVIEASGVWVKLTRGGVTTLLDSAAFTLVNASDDGFTVRLLAGAAAADVVQIGSTLIPARTQALQYGGAVRTPVLESDAVKFMALIQELRRDVAVLLAFMLTGGTGGGGSGGGTTDTGGLLLEEGGQLGLEEGGVLGPEEGASTPPTTTTSHRLALEAGGLLGREDGGALEPEG